MKLPPYNGTAQTIERKDLLSLNFSELMRLWKALLVAYIPRMSEAPQTVSHVEYVMPSGTVA